MASFQWKILNITSECKSVHYLLSATDGVNTVESEGNHVFSDGIVSIEFSKITEQNILDWLEKDTTQDDVNAIKLNLEKQLKDLESDKKVELPWITAINALTFTVE
jgi:hypothetical protein